MKKWWPLLFFLLALDVATKIAAIHWIPPLSYSPYPFGGIGIFSFGGITCSLNYIVNTGAAWGMFAGYSGLLFAIRTLIILGLVFFVPKRFPIWLVVTGAIGNAIDYCLYGHVVDFLHFTFWGYSFPIFNVADSCITIGVLALLIFSGKDKAVKAI
ncbi:MAG: signal peptidase II [Chlamydiae bacterium CG10_big_fil_rev_8_21_14_0_10_42_34]|nr:MAG: signal peptidase II [Chlamydiae bacterium CG10_big_fil_rev_8_21_14_0_10_42_34]